MSTESDERRAAVDATAALAAELAADALAHLRHLAIDQEAAAILARRDDTRSGWALNWRLRRMAVRAESTRFAVEQLAQLAAELVVAGDEPAVAELIAEYGGKP